MMMWLHATVRGAEAAAAVICAAYTGIDMQ